MWLHESCDAGWICRAALCWTAVGGRPYGLRGDYDGETIAAKCRSLTSFGMTICYKAYRSTTLEGRRGWAITQVLTERGEKMRQ